MVLSHLRGFIAGAAGGAAAIRVDQRRQPLELEQAVDDVLPGAAHGFDEAIGDVEERERGHPWLELVAEGEERLLRGGVGVEQRGELAEAAEQLVQGAAGLLAAPRLSSLSCSSGSGRGRGPGSRARAQKSSFVNPHIFV